MNCLDKSLRFAGRWSVTEERAIATAPGAFFYLAFMGQYAVLHFETEWMSGPYPHLWISMDDGPWFETALDRHLRIQAKEGGNHVVKVVFKSAIEMAHRWYQPLDGRVEFLGYDAQKAGVLDRTPKKQIEFVGDSITEGVLIDEALGEGKEWFGRPYQDDAMAGYAWLTAEALGLEPLIMGYGSVGVTKGGCGGVPKACEAYPFCYDNAAISYKNPDYIVINHGTNDCLHSSEEFMEGYCQLLDTIAVKNPKSRLFVMVPFCGVFRDELYKIVDEFRERYDNRIDLIDTVGWTDSTEPIHPDREGHQRLASKLTAELKKFGL